MTAPLASSARTGLVASSAQAGLVASSASAGSVASSAHPGLAGDPLDLADRLIDRLCHDLSGPLGTLIAASELCSEALGPDAPGGEEAGVTSAAAAELGRRMRLLRLAWGAQSPPVGRAEFAHLATSLSGRRRVRVDVSGFPVTGRLDGGLARVAANALLLGLESLAGAGTLAVAGSVPGEAAVTIAGPRAGWPGRLGQWLADEAAAWRALEAEDRSLQGPLTALIARRCGVAVSLAGGSGDPSSPPSLRIASGVRG